MTYRLNFTCIGNKHTTEFIDFDPFKLSHNELNELCYMLHRTYEAINKIDEYAELYDEVNKNEFKIKNKKRKR